MGGMTVSNWIEVVQQAQDVESLREMLTKQREVYPASVTLAGDQLLFMVKEEHRTKVSREHMGMYVRDLYNGQFILQNCL
jgi:hypothetical protein